MRRKRRSRSAGGLGPVVCQKRQSWPDVIECRPVTDRDTFVATYGPLFEHSPWVAEDAYAKGPFSDEDEVYEALTAAMYAAPRERQLALLRAHPDLGAQGAG